MLWVNQRQSSTGMPCHLIVEEKMCGQVDSAKKCMARGFLWKKYTVRGISAEKCLARTNGDVALLDSKWECCRS